MTFELKNNMDNAAFEDNGRFNELESCLKAVIKQLQECHISGKIRDSNGNTVGSYEVVK